jgi:hypothetical protein
MFHLETQDVRAERGAARVARRQEQGLTDGTRLFVEAHIDPTDKQQTLPLWRERLPRSTTAVAATADGPKTTDNPAASAATVMVVERISMGPSSVLLVTDQTRISTRKRKDSPYRHGSGNCSSRSRSSGRIMSPISWFFVLAVLGSKLADQPKITAQFGVTSRGLLQIASQCPSSAW